MALTSRICLSGCLALVGFILAGCSPTPPPPAANQGHSHEHEGSHGHPTTYAAAVKMIEDLNAEVKEHAAANELKKADEHVHELGHILDEDIKPLVDKTDLADDAKAEVKKAIDELFDSFMKLDETIHSGKGPSYDELSEKISAGLATLRKHVPGENAPAKAPEGTNP